MLYKFKNHEIELYDSIQNLPILRFMKLNKYTMMASGIGDDFQDYQRHSKKIIAFLGKNMIQEAIQEINNQSQLVYNVYNEQSPTGNSFAVLVYRIDNVTYDKDSPSDFEQILKHLDRIGFDIQTSIEKLTQVKKKSTSNWRSTFLSTFQRLLTRKKSLSVTSD